MLAFGVSKRSVGLTVPQIRRSKRDNSEIISILKKNHHLDCSGEGFQQMVPTRNKEKMILELPSKPHLNWSYESRQYFLCLRRK